MIRIKELTEQLLHLVGWQQSYDTSEIYLSSNLTQSESGMYFQQMHPLLTLQNLLSIAPDFKNTNFTSHSVNSTYKKGTVVKVEDKLYKSISDVPQNIEISNTEFWCETNLFSEWLEDKTKASIIKLVNKFINMKLADKASKSLIENKTLFDGTGRITSTVRNRHNFVGFELDTIRSKGVTVKINKIGLQFTKPGTYKIFIMHSSNDAPIYICEFTKVRNNSIEWFVPKEDILLPYESDFNDAGGSWYIGYFQSDLPEGSEAISRDRDWSTQPCKACSRSEFLAWQAWSKYIEVHPFYIDEDQIQAVRFNDEDFDDSFEKQQIHMWDVENITYQYDNNYGINLELSAYCDLTDFIIKQRHIFQDVIAKQVAVDFLREFAYNPNVRTNRRSINASRTDILYELDGDSSSMKHSGLNYELDLALKALNFSTQGLDRVCLPCVNHGLKYRTV